jgi:hypothetical protein
MGDFIHASLYSKGSICHSMFKTMVLKTFVTLFTILNNVTGLLPNVNKVVSLFALWIISLRFSERNVFKNKT